MAKKWHFDEILDYFCEVFQENWRFSDFYFFWVGNKLCFKTTTFWPTNQIYEDYWQFYLTGSFLQAFENCSSFGHERNKNSRHEFRRSLPILRWTIIFSYAKHKFQTVKCQIDSIFVKFHTQNWTISSKILWFWRRSNFKKLIKVARNSNRSQDYLMNFRKKCMFVASFQHWWLTIISKANFYHLHVT